MSFQYLPGATVAVPEIAYKPKVSLPRRQERRDRRRYAK